MPEYLAKQNQDGSYSISIPAGELAEYAFVDYYNEKGATGFQRNETLTPTRARDIGKYIKRCVKAGIPPRLFEMTGNGRMDHITTWKFAKLDEEAALGFLEVEAEEGKRWLSIIDGGTRWLGIKNALSDGSIPPDLRFDVRIFSKLSLAQEIALFLLINDKQKKVRTDLSLRVVQRLLDENQLPPEDITILESVVPDTDTWKYEASRLTAQLNDNHDSPWQNLIKMPGDKTSRPVKLQAMFSSLKPLLTDDLRTDLDLRAEREGLLTSAGPVSRTEYLLRVLTNFWNAVAKVCPQAHAEPKTTVLWGSIGASACNLALSKIIPTILNNEDAPDLREERLARMLLESVVADYPFWFSKAGKGPADSYPGAKGEATTMTGGAGYARLAKRLEQEWRAALHSSTEKKQALA